MAPLKSLERWIENQREERSVTHVLLKYRVLTNRHQAYTIKVVAAINPVGGEL